MCFHVCYFILKGIKALLCERTNQGLTPPSLRSCKKCGLIPDPSGHSYIFCGCVWNFPFLSLGVNFFSKTHEKSLGSDKSVITHCDTLIELHFPRDLPSFTGYNSKWQVWVRMRVYLGSLCVFYVQMSGCLLCFLLFIWFISCPSTLKTPKCCSPASQCGNCCRSTGCPIMSACCCLHPHVNCNLGLRCVCERVN